MTQEEQTEQVIVELYNLTRQFTFKYQPLYYIQYRGDLEDLCADFFCDFMQKKSRIEGEEESLLDKFDSKITTLPYLVKVAVKRKLIDRSRADKAEIRIDPIMEKLGDSANTRLNLVYEPDEVIEQMIFDCDDLFRAKHQFSLLPKETQNKVRRYFAEVKNCIAPNVLSMVSKVIDRNLTAKIAGKEYKCCQVTEKSLQFNMDGKIVTFNRDNGEQRASVREYVMSAKDVKKFESVECFRNDSMFEEL